MSAIKSLPKQMLANCKSLLTRPSNEKQYSTGNSLLALNSLIFALLLLPKPIFGETIAIRGIMTSTSYSPREEAFSRAVHPFEVTINDAQWKLRFEDEDVNNGTKLGPAYIECGFDGTSVYTKLVFTGEMRMKMSKEPTLNGLVLKDPSLAKARIDLEQAKSSNDPRRMPLNTNDASVYIDQGNYPRRLPPAGKLIWLTYCAADLIRSTTNGLIPDPFSIGTVNWKFGGPVLKRNELIPDAITFTHTQAVTKAKGYMFGPAMATVLASTNWNNLLIPTVWQFQKHYPKQYTGKDASPYHVCIISNVVISTPRANEFEGSLPRLEGPTFIQDARFASASLGYVETNGKFLSTNSSESRLKLEAIKKFHSERAKLIRSTGSRRWSALLVFILALVPILILTALAVRLGRKNTTRTNI